MWPFRKKDDQEQVGTEVPYWLVLSRFRARGTLVRTKDSYDGESALAVGLDAQIGVVVRDISVELVQQSDTNVGRYGVRTGSGTQDVSVTLTADGRLQSVQHKSVGAGASMVAAGVKLVGFVVGTVVSVASTLVKAGALADDKAEEPPPPLSPREAWASDNADAAQLLTDNKVLALAASNRLVTLRTEMVTSCDVATSRSLAARIETVSTALHAARAEVARIETLYATWREGQRQTHTATIECLVDLDQVAARVPGTVVTQPPNAPQDGEVGYALWRDFRLILQVVDSRRDADAPRMVAPAIGADGEDRVVRWRVPRTIELWVWSQQGTKSDITLVTRAPVTVVDSRSDSHGMELRSGVFGEHGGMWMFGDDGAPTAITTNDKSTAGALADVLGSVPEQLVGAVDQAKKLTDSINGIQDAAAERKRVAAERDLATAKARIEVLGLNATEEDSAALARAEQAVKLRTVTRSLTPDAVALQDLKDELDRAKTQNDLDAARRTANVESQLVDVKAELARLEQQVLIAKAHYDKLNPGKGD